jgi:hypothetical protein
MRHFPWREMGWAGGCVAALLLVYLVAYAILVRPAQVPPQFLHASRDDAGVLGSDFSSITDSELETNWVDRAFIVRIKPEYLLEHKMCRDIFAPIHDLDAVLRFDTWHFAIPF